METNLLHHAPLHTPLLNHPPRLNNNGHKPSKGIFVMLCSIVFLMSLLALIMIMIMIKSQNHSEKFTETTPFDSFISPRGVSQGVSPKSNLFHRASYNWTNAMFSWQRTAFHFQPQKNWMNGRCLVYLLHGLISFLCTYFN